LFGTDSETYRILSEYLDYLRNNHYEYSYINGLENGYNSSSFESLNKHLDSLRNNNYEYSYIKGFEDGYNMSVTDMIEEMEK